MSALPEKQPSGPRFVRKAFFDQPDLVGARWWREGLEVAASPVSRRTALVMLASIGAAVAGVGGAVWLVTGRGRGSAASGVSESGRLASLEVQREAGFDAGHAGQALAWPDAVELDAGGTAAWRRFLGALSAELAPKQPALAPHYVPTLFASLGAEPNAKLHDAVRPIHSAAMEEAFQKGRALLTLFAGQPPDTAIVADLPGERSVAFAAALADRFDPVFTFDNWPHPAGVVPSHLAIGAALYELPLFQSAAAARTTPAPPLFVLDDRRLAPYTDSPTQFDNRYLAKLPSAKALQALGVRHVLYVRPAADPLRELDDLNDEFVAWRAGGVDVKILPLTDFSRATGAAASSPASSAPAQNLPPNPSGYWYGGHPHFHPWFWPIYGWHPWGYPALGPRPTTISNGAAFEPSTRSTLFSRGRPAGFGTSPFTSHSSGSTGRSGSLGRSGSSWGG